MWVLRLGRTRGTNLSVRVRFGRGTGDRVCCSLLKTFCICLHLLAVLSSFGEDFVVAVALDLYVVAGDFCIHHPEVVEESRRKWFCGISQAFAALDLVERTGRT